MDILWEFIGKIDVPNLIAIGTLIGFCYMRMGKKLDQIEDRLSKRIDKLDEKVTDIDRRLCRLEGAFASKDCCMIKDDRMLRKAE